jgi:P27 family predicted phage terminase small subunit
MLMTVNGRGGRPKKPTALRVLHGDRKDRINTDEPVPAATVVEPPSWLPVDAVQVWDRYAGDLVRQGVLTAWDVELFACWCDSAARRRRAVEALRAEGEIVEMPVFGKNGELSGYRRGKNPWAFVLTEADVQVARYGARFGLSPADRAALSSEKAPRRDPTEDLLTG